ncbi:HemK2/MTQ2 family protein methyltransferase [Mycolicibacterium confluentis]|uniref:Methylase n=1 Tax=Mycolicibacterium confluentis TaxID=28047 RepID=A0A7I7Y3I4_9MYCO|nr:HemK2/MTQ2 family protein methyltransferase [Mycolicibacterium confluentis]MCV7318285.1 methyltransferase [Mycolicibacterium confluentis]ORV29607.1 methylase [Mycolicibacterium confluentis]BBZ36196.1 methylase [Mycolicibacterium confluentis]
MTTARRGIWPASVPEDVYPPQEDSQLLIDTAVSSGRIVGQRVADLCAGSGVVGIAAAAEGAADVRAFEICPRAVHEAKTNAAVAGVDMNVHLGPWTRAAEFAPFDVVLSNPPYVPDFEDERERIPTLAGPPQSYNGGYDGRAILDPLCLSVADLLAPNGTFFLVHSEFSGVDRSLNLLRGTGLSADVVARQMIPFGPVLNARAAWLERTRLLELGRRVEELIVIRADKL